MKQAGLDHDLNDLYAKLPQLVSEDTIKAFTFLPKGWTFDHFEETPNSMTDFIGALLDRSFDFDTASDNAWTAFLASDADDFDKATLPSPFAIRAERERRALEEKLPMGRSGRAAARL